MRFAISIGLAGVCFVMLEIGPPVVSSARHEKRQKMEQGGRVNHHG